MYYNSLLFTRAWRNVSFWVGISEEEELRKLGGYEASGWCWIWPADGGTQLRAATHRLYFMWHPLSCIEYENVLRTEN